MEISLAIVADAANISQEGKLNILGQFDTIYVRKLPGSHPPVPLVLRVSFTALEKGKERDILVVLLDPDGKQLGEMRGKLQIDAAWPPHVTSVNLIVQVPLLRFETYGAHSLQVLINDDFKAAVPLMVAPPVDPSDPVDAG